MAERPLMHQVAAADSADPGAESRRVATAQPEPTHAERCRTLVVAATRGALSTLAVEPAGYPYGSVASFALDHAGNPLFFVSLMAEHTQNIIRDPRASLLVAAPVPEGADPLAGGRVTLMGTMAQVSADDRHAVREAYLAANPSSAYYIDFGDFVFCQLTVESIRYVGGYGRMSWVNAAEYAAASPDPLAASSANIIEHMNADHADAQVLFCRLLAGHTETVSATMSSVDRYGFEMIAVGPGGRHAVRLGFAQPCNDGDQVRRAMVAMLTDARTQAATTESSSQQP